MWISRVKCLDKEPGQEVRSDLLQGKCTSKKLLWGQAFTSSKELVKFTSLKATFFVFTDDIL